MGDDGTVHVETRFDHTTAGQRVLFGGGTVVPAVQTAVTDLGASRVLLIANAFATGTADAIASAVPVVVRIDAVQQHVPTDAATAAVHLARQNEVDAVVSIGGGSATGLAKILGRDLHLPLIAVPTTFAGSEATSVWGETRKGQKVTGVDRNVLPRVVVYDPQLLVSLPGHLVISSGLNAVAHAVDSFWAPRADPINRALSTESLHALFPALRKLSKRPADESSREQAMYGAYLAGVAFSSAGSGMHHKICHILGGAYNLSHSETHAVVLPYVTEFNAPAAPDAEARISRALEGAPAARGLYELKLSLGGAASLAELGLPETAIPEVAALALEAIPSSNPRQVAIADVVRIIEKAWTGAAVE